MEAINFIAVKKFVIIGIILMNISNFACMQGSPMEIHQRVACSRSKNVFLMLMDTMMRNMEPVKAGISPDYDFMSQMIAHHQAAVQMARYEIKNGRNFLMVQLAKSIVAEQTVEIQQMQFYKKCFLPGDYPLNDKFKKEMNKTMDLMTCNMPTDQELDNVDTAFALVMMAHH